MLGWSGRAKRTVIGLDVGMHGARAVQLVGTPDRLTIAGTLVFDHAVDDSNDDPSRRRLADRIQNSLRVGPFTGKKVSTSLSSPTVSYYALELPASIVSDDSRHATQVIRHEIERLSEVSNEEVEMTHWRLPATRAQAPNVMGVASARDSVLGASALCDAAGLRCGRVDVGAAALSRFAALLKPWGEKDIWGVLDLGYTESRLILCVDQTPVLVRRVGDGGQNWSQLIADTLEVSIQAAEVQKCTHGITMSGRGVRPSSYGELGSTPGKDIGSILFGALRVDLRNLASEIKRSFEYVLSCYPSQCAADLVLVGGGSGLENLGTFLGDALGIPVRGAGHYLQHDSCGFRFATSKQQRFEVLAHAIGLAIDPRWSPDG